MPKHAINSGDSPIELHTAAAVKRPVEGFFIVANVQPAPTTRRIVKMMRKIKPPERRNPWRQIRKAARKKDGR